MESTNVEKLQAEITELEEKTKKAEEQLEMEKFVIKLAKISIAAMKEELTKQIAANNQKEPCDNPVGGGYADNPELQPGAKAAEPNHVLADEKEE